MKARIIFATTAIISGITFLNSCIKHEVIPAPEKKVALSCNFLGTINGTTIEFTQDVNGYTCYPTKALSINPSPTPSTATYFSNIASTTNNVSIKLGLGSGTWDNGANSELPLSDFKALFNGYLSPTNPTYKTDALYGFMVVYKDGNNNVWTSKATSPNPQDVVISNLLQESDASGDYMKFNCVFNCYVYRQLTFAPAAETWDSLKIQNAQFKGWFKR